jgi:hypothetical protein
MTRLKPAATVAKGFADELDTIPAIREPAISM